MGVSLGRIHENKQLIMIDIYSLALTQVHGIGPAIAKKLMEVYPSAEAFFNESHSNLTELFGKKEQTISDIINRPMLSRCEQELEYMYKNNINAYFIKDEAYPFRLKQIDSPPTCLFVKGEGDLNKKRIVSIVGSRQASEYGKWVTANIVRELKAFDVCIVSGLAYGIDSIAHISALNEGLSTFGVLGHGLDKVYPAQNYPLAQNMLANGGLVSEFFTKTVANNYNFPQRNRIIAALCDLCIVIEGGVKSGSMITPRYAREFNREVLAVPGRIGDVLSEGCNNLIASNIAGMLSNFSEIESTMGWGENKKEKVKDLFSQDEKPKPQKSLAELSETERQIYEFISKSGKTNIDDIIAECSLDFAKTSIGLMNLELKGYITALPGKHYECC